jgi:hypothetical protein
MKDFKEDTEVVAGVVTAIIVIGLFFLVYQLL